MYNPEYLSTQQWDWRDSGLLELAAAEADYGHLLDLGVPAFVRLVETGSDLLLLIVASEPIPEHEDYIQEDWPEDQWEELFSSFYNRKITKSLDRSPRWRTFEVFAPIMAEISNRYIYATSPAGRMEADAMAQKIVSSFLEQSKAERD